MELEFEKIECVSAFYDDFSSTIFYVFNTVPVIGHGEWAISGGGDCAYDLRTDHITQDEFPHELMLLLDHIPEDIHIEDWDE